MSKLKKIPFLFFLLLINICCFFANNITAQITVISEDFSGGALPTGWSNNIITGSVTDTWRYNNPGGRTTFAPIAGNFAIFDSDNYSNNSLAEDIALETSAFDASSFTILTLSFDHMFRYCCSGNAVVEVFNGTSWIQVYSAGSTSVGYSTSTNSQTIDILGAAAGATNAKIRFRYTGNWSYWWAIDNILIEASTTCFPTFSEQTVDANFNGAIGVYAEDMDDDGDMDLLGAGLDEDEITWWENDGSENFTERIIESSYNGASAVHTIDLDDDGDMDVVGSAIFDDLITWWENDGSENFTTHTVSNSYDGAYYIVAKDVDGDNHLDLITGGRFNDDVTW